MNVRITLLFVSLLLSLNVLTVQAQELMPEDEVLPYVALKPGSDLQADSKMAKEKQVPLLLFFSMEHCPFCTIVEEDFLKPILRNAEYDNKVIIRKVKIDDSDFVNDFNGESREAGEFSDDYNVSMVPTVVLVDANGKMINPSIIGIRNTHYYSAELDDAIDASIHKIRAIAKR